MATLVYAYGVGRLPDGTRWTPPPRLRDQLNLAREMYNDLVTTWRDQDGDRAAIWAAHPAVAAAEQAVQDAAHAVDALAAQVRAERSADRTVRARTGTARQLTAARATLTAARAARAEARASARAETRPALALVTASYKDAVKQTRKDYAARGLYWGTYNYVVDAHRAAAQAVNEARASGRPARMSYRRRDGAAGVGVQLQRQAGDPPRTPATVAGGEGKWRNVLRLTWWPPATLAGMGRGARRALARAAVATIAVGGGQTIDVPVVLHRPLPPDAEIVEALLTLRQTAGHTRARLSVVVRLPDPDPPCADGAHVAVHCGWRMRPDGSVRVATVKSTTPLPDVPAQLAGIVLTREDGRTAEVVYPARWLADADRPPRIRSERDKAQAAAQDRVAAWLDEHPQDVPGRDGEPMRLTGADVRRWRSPARLAWLAQRWRESPPAAPGGPEVATGLEVWRRWDKRRWQQEAHGRDRQAGRRTDAWRNVAAWLLPPVGRLVVDDMDLTTLRRRTDEAETSPVRPERDAEQARSRAAVVAPGLLRQVVVEAAARRGVPVVEVTAAGLTRTCPTCGGLGPAGDPRYARSAVVRCAACGASYDQDTAAAALMLARAREPGV